MIANKFVAYSSKEISNQFPSLSISYEYRPKSMTHYLKVLPSKIYLSDDFMNLEARLYEEWLKLSTNEDEDFCIISSESLVQLEKDELIYKPESTVKISFSWSNKKASLSFPLEKIYLNEISINEVNFSVEGENNLNKNIYSHSQEALAA